MGRVDKVTAGSPLAIKATEWNAIADAVNVGVEQRVRSSPLQQSVTVLVRNDAGVDLDRYDCGSLSDPLFELQANGSVDLIFKLLKAGETKTPAILTEPIAHDGTNKRFGRCWIHGLAYAFVGPGSATAVQAAPEATNNRLKPGSGNIRLLAPPHASDEKLLPVLLGASDQTQIYKYVLEEDMGSITPGYGALATIIDVAGDGATIATEATLMDPIGLSLHQVTGGIGLCWAVGDTYWVIVPECEPEDVGSSGAPSP